MLQVKSRDKWSERKRFIIHPNIQPCPPDGVRNWPDHYIPNGLHALDSNSWLCSEQKTGADEWAPKTGAAPCLFSTKRSQLTFLRVLFSVCSLAEFRASRTSTPWLPIPVHISTHPLHCMKSKWQTYGQQSIFIPSLLPADMFNMLKLHLKDCIESVSCLYLMYGRTLYIAPNVEQTVT